MNEEEQCVNEQEKGCKEIHGIIGEAANEPADRICGQQEIMIDYIYLSHMERYSGFNRIV